MQTVQTVQYYNVSVELQFDGFGVAGANCGSNCGVTQGGAFFMFVFYGLDHLTDLLAASLGLPFASHFCFNRVVSYPEMSQLAVRHRF